MKLTEQARQQLAQAQTTEEAENILSNVKLPHIVKINRQLYHVTDSFRIVNRENSIFIDFYRNGLRISSKNFGVCPNAFDGVELMLENVLIFEPLVVGGEFESTKDIPETDANDLF